MPSPVYMKRTTATFAVQTYIFSDTSSAYRSRNSEGGFRLRSDYFSIFNQDSTAGLFFSWDNTDFGYLLQGQSYASPLHTDRFYVKSDSSDVACSYQAIAVLHTDRDMFK